ncbi:hypothetical protein GCM10017687_78300 [Streptomyces echinatus]
MQRHVRVAEAGVQLQRQAQIDGGPQQVPYQHRVGEPAAPRQPVPGRPCHLGVRGALRGEGEAGPVGRDRLHRHHVRAAYGLLGGGAQDGRVLARLHAPRRHRLGELLQPYDLARGGAGRGRQLGGGGERVRRVAGVHAEHLGSGGRQEAAVDLLPAECRAPGQVVGGRGVPGEVQQGRAVPAHGDADGTVEGGDAGPGRALGDQGLEPSGVQVRRHRAVAVVVHQRQRGEDLVDRSRCGHGQYTQR